jgi:hypothetical protein
LKEEDLQLRRRTCPLPIRIIGAKATGVEHGVVLIHPKFRVIALANRYLLRGDAAELPLLSQLTVPYNRPGYPFLGNDFYREIGDCFSW